MKIDINVKFNTRQAIFASVRLAVSSFWLVMSVDIAHTASDVVVIPLRFQLLLSVEC